MKSKGLERLLRLLLVLLGIGIGLALFQVGLQWYQLATRDAGIPAWLPAAGAEGMILRGFFSGIWTSLQERSERISWAVFLQLSGESSGTCSTTRKTSRDSLRTRLATS